MIEDSPTPAEVINLSHTETPQDLVAAYYASLRTGWGRVWNVAAYGMAAVLVIHAVWNALAGHYMLTGMLVALIAYFILRNRINSWRLQRWYRKKFGGQLAVTREITSHQLSSKDGLGNESVIAWPMIEKVLRFDKGFLVFYGSRSYFPIPLRAFSDPGDLDRFIEYAKAGARRYVDKS